MKYADVRFNDGAGALLCNNCKVILAHGFDHEDQLHYCTKCEEAIKELENEDEQFNKSKFDG